ncbi:MAG TPA: hypothetical protein VGR29_06125 [Thermomicrobiales bacterium]|nr:hypothetical protein [Thermomicrobiales bacterium]
MTDGQMFVVALRVVLPLLILRKPLLGGILAMLLDALDVVIVELFGAGGMGHHYHSIDKVLDLYYLGLEAWVALSWIERIPRISAIALFLYRVAGVVIFELTQWRPTLFIFPNLFEHWFLFYLIRSRFFPGLRLNAWKNTIIWLAILYIPKLAQEYLLHVAQAQPWDWVKGVLGI